MSRNEPTSASRDAAISEAAASNPGVTLVEARLDAQRRLLQWLVAHVVTDRATYDRLIETLDVPWPPADFQEDPGAVNSEAFGLMSAYNREMRMLLRLIKETPPTR